MSNLFQERFKNRTSLMPSGGILKIALTPLPGYSDKSSKSLPKVSKPSSSTSPLNLNLKKLIPGAKSDRDVFERPNKLKILIKSDRNGLNPLPVQQKSASPVLKKSSFLVEGEEKLNKSSSRSYYKPYSVKDYNSIKFRKYFVLGGLGASHIGTEDWQKKKDLHEKRTQYGRATYLNNAAIFPKPIQAPRLSEQTSFRKRALDFAKTILKPPLRVQLITSD
jgi:hypothetical protein